jgi:hypothetical protein
MQIDCARQQHAAWGFTFQSISASRLALLAGAAMSSIRVQVMVCAFLTVIFGSATAQARLPFESAG